MNGEQDGPSGADGTAWRSSWHPHQTLVRLLRAHFSAVSCPTWKPPRWTRLASPSTTVRVGASRPTRPSFSLAPCSRPQWLHQLRVRRRARRPPDSAPRPRPPRRGPGVMPDHPAHVRSGTVRTRALGRCAEVASAGKTQQYARKVGLVLRRAKAMAWRGHKRIASGRAALPARGHGLQSGVRAGLQQPRRRGERLQGTADPG